MKRYPGKRAGLTGVLCTFLFLLNGCGGSSSSDSPPPASSGTPDTSTEVEWNNSNWNEGEWQ